MAGKIQKSPFSDFHHVGIVVKDMNKTIQYLASLGIGPFEPHLGGPSVDRRLRGKPTNAKIDVCFAQIGPLRVELLQPLEGESIQMEFLESKGEGIHHLGFSVDDIWQEVDELTKQGMKVIQSGKWVTGGGFAYLDSDKPGGILMELGQR